MSSHAEVLPRIDEALRAASEILRRFTPGKVEARDKGGGDPVTEADNAVDEALRTLLPRDDDGWLSEETVDDPIRLDKRRVWVVDPLDGTREFVQGIPEWCVSVGLVADGRAVAGGICNPASGETIIGSLDTGVTYNGQPARVSAQTNLREAVVLGSRSEVKRGEWDRFDDGAFKFTPMGSVAYKLGLVAAGRADITWTLVPKHEWDIAAGVALIHAAGGKTYTLDGREPVFNRPKPKVTGLVAVPPSLDAQVREQIAFALTVDTD